jgi:ABC-type phosphate/phosphonate transport system permease subunit
MDMNAQTITGIVTGIILGGLLLLGLKDMQGKSVFVQMLMLIFVVLPLAFIGWCVIALS